MARLLALLVGTAVFLVPVGASPAQATPDDFSPRAGVIFNSPVSDRTRTKRAIFNKILRSVNSSPRGSEIQFLTWNFLTREATDALLRAERRGVTVRVLIDRRNTTELDNRPFRRLRHGLRQGRDSLRRGQEPSWARTCERSCRGRGGAAHAKFFMFSQAGRVPRVVMQGSANLTKAAANNQWNDLYTHTRNREVWRFYDRVFTQATRDRKARRMFLSRQFDGFRLMMFPLGRSRDPVMQLLDQVRCRRATNTASGRTVIRIAPDVIRTKRGMNLARKVRDLWDSGCDIKIGYTVLGIDVSKVLREDRRDSGGRGPVPLAHLTEDHDYDGQFDLYFHLKAMSIIGNVAGDRGNHVVLNGSANWSRLARASDENLGVYWNRRLAERYQEHIDYWFDRYAPTARRTSSARMAPRSTTTEGLSLAPTGNPLVFGTGPDAVYADGTPYSTTGIDPFANLELD